MTTGHKFKVGERVRITVNSLPGRRVELKKGDLVVLGSWHSEDIWSLEDQNIRGVQYYLNGECYSLNGQALPVTAFAKLVKHKIKLKE